MSCSFAFNFSDSFMRLNVILCDIILLPRTDFVHLTRFNSTLILKCYQISLCFNAYKLKLLKLVGSVCVCTTGHLTFLNVLQRNGNRNNYINLKKEKKRFELFIYLQQLVSYYLNFFFVGVYITW